MERKAFETINPATEEVIESYPLATNEEVDRVLSRSHEAQRQWARTNLSKRIEVLGRIADLFESKQDELGELMTREMGKPVAQARAEAAKCAWAFRYYAEHAPRFLADVSIPSDTSHSGFIYQPLGTVFAIMPWNYPFWQVARFAAPALAAGNAGILKHAPNSTGSGLAFAKLLLEAGVPEGVFQTLVIDTDQAADVIGDERIAAVTLTGSERAGRSVAASAGKHLKKCVLELGGSDAYVLLDDADLDKAIEVGLKARYQNNGQSCIAAKRFIVDEKIHDEFCTRFSERVAAFKVGDPFDEQSDIGPMARGDLREGIAKQVEASVSAGARVLTGGKKGAGKGFYYEPTVLAGVVAGMPAADEEMFGPVASVLRAKDEAHALELANATPYGLGGSVWSRDRERGERFARGMVTGGVFVNGMTKSDPRLPFGGVKHSGYGRELSEVGIHEFMNIKTLWVAEEE